jgi:alkylation response protein AidB-like acyl-CoA dehydrogenase
VAVYRDELLREPDRGFAVAMRTLNLFRPSVARSRWAWRRPRWTIIARQLFS